MIDGLSITDPKWRLVELACKERLDVLVDRLQKATDPVDIYRLQGAIVELKNLIRPPDTV